MSRWWSLSEAMLREVMDRAAAGEDPDLLLAELYANSDSEQVPPDPLPEAVMRLGVHATGAHVTPVDTDALGEVLDLARSALTEEGA